MRILRAVIKKEVVHHLVSFRFLVLTAIFVVLSALAALAGTESYTWRQRSFAAHLEQQRQALAEVHVYSFLQPLVARAPEPLAVFDRGFEGRLGSQVTINLFTIPARATKSALDNPFMTSFRGLDLTTLVAAVLGLLAFLLTFDAVAGERENGTLKLVLANSLRRSTFLAGKFAGALLTLFLPLGLGLAAFLLIFHGRSGDDLDPGRWLRLAGLVAAYLLYLALMVGLGLLLSLLPRRASAALVVSMLTWLLLVFLQPQIALFVAHRTTGGGSENLLVEVTELEKARDRELAELWREDPLRSRPSGHASPVVESTWNRGVLRRFGSPRYYDAATRFHQQEAVIGQRYADQVFAAHETFAQALRRGQKLAAWLSFPSPAFLLRQVAESLAGTSVADYDAYLAAGRAYRLDLIAYLEMKDAFGSWRWFTDDTPTELYPWPKLLGLTPEDVDETNIAQLAGRFREPEIQERLRQHQAAFQVEPSRQLDTRDLPAFPVVALGLGEASRRVLIEIVTLLTLTALLATLALRRFRSYAP